MSEASSPFALVHVGTVQSHGLRVLPGDEPPEWAKVPEGTGDMSLRGWFENHVLALLSTTIARDDLAISVTLGGLYQVDSSALAEVVKDDPQSMDTLERMPVDAKRRLSEQALPDLYPFMRELVFRTSSGILPNSAIMLVPRPPEPGTPASAVPS